MDCANTLNGFPGAVEREAKTLTDDAQEFHHLRVTLKAGSFLPLNFSYHSGDPFCEPEYLSPRFKNCSCK